MARVRAELEETSRSVEEAQKALRAKYQTSQETIKKSNMIKRNATSSRRQVRKRTSLPTFVKNQGDWLALTKIFAVKLSQIQPSQLYINSERLSEIMTALDRLKPDSIEPIPVKKLGDKIVFTDDHTRALAAFLHGASEVRVYWEEDELDWDAYEVCVEWCRKEGVRTIADLKNRVVSPKEYDVLWVERCKKMQQDLEARRKQGSDEKAHRP